MRRLIDTTGTLLDNPWQLLPKDATPEAALADPASQLIVPLQLWLAHGAELLAAGKQVGVWLDSDEQATALAGSLDKLALVALNFPKFVDGRSSSTAFVLRRQYGYQGELRAIGEVLRDQLFYMKRCGFTTFELEETVKLEDARRAFSDFRDNYQSTVEEPLPLFRRKERPGLSLQD
jgi:uncharacterized protein (DUF934 family)